jgi:hypothetical protein
MYMEQNGEVKRKLMLNAETIKLLRDAQLKRYMKTSVIIDDINTGNDCFPK